jgi:hypothetical protein
VGPKKCEAKGKKKKTITTGKYISEGWVIYLYRPADFASGLFFYPEDGGSK